MRDKNLKPIPEPIGHFILSDWETKPVQTDTGAYYHYVDVCRLLERKGRIEQLRAYRVVYWRNLFEIRYENTSAPDVIKHMMSCYTATLISCNAFIHERIMELLKQLYPHCFTEKTNTI